MEQKKKFVITAVDNLTEQQEIDYFNSIVFLKNAAKIYTHGAYFGGSAESSEGLEDIESRLSTLEGITEEDEKVIAESIAIINESLKNLSKNVSDLSGDLSSIKQHGLGKEIDEEALKDSIQSSTFSVVDEKIKNSEDIMSALIANVNSRLEIVQDDLLTDYARKDDFEYISEADFNTRLENNSLSSGITYYIYD